MQEAESKWISRSAFVAVAAAYAACFEILRYLSFSHWNLMAGLRFAALLMVPRRYWPALLLGEWIPLIEIAVFNSEAFGLDWALCVGVPIIALSMPAVALGRRTMAVPYRHDGEVNVPGLVVLALACSLITATCNSFCLMMVPPAGHGEWPAFDAGRDFTTYFLGAYPGALALAPTIIVLKEAMTAQGSRAWRAAWKRPSTIALVTASVALWVAATMLAPSMHGAPRQLMRMSTALPVLAFTLRFGWKGAALAGFLADVAMAYTNTTLPDVSMHAPKAVLALVVSGALLAGLPITRWRKARARSAPSRCATSR